MVTYYRINTNNLLKTPSTKYRTQFHQPTFSRFQLILPSFYTKPSFHMHQTLMLNNENRKTREMNVDSFKCFVEFLLVETFHVKCFSVKVKLEQTYIGMVSECVCCYVSEVKFCVQPRQSFWGQKCWRPVGAGHLKLSFSVSQQ